MRTGVSFGQAAKPRRVQVIAAILAVLAALTGSVHFSVILRAPLGYLLVGVIPGWLLAESFLRSDGSTPEETAMISLAFSMPFAIVGRSLVFRLGVPAQTFLWIWAVTCATWAALLKPRAPGPPSDRVAWLIAGALALLVALPAGLNHVTRVYGDAMFHGQIVNEIRLRGIPPQDPSFAGMPLTYMWQFHVWAAALSEAMGLSPYGVFPWVGGAMMVALSFGAYRVASVFWPERLHRRLAPLVVALGMNALGGVLALARIFLGPLVGHDHGLGVLRLRVSEYFIHPNATTVCSSLIYNSYFILCSLLFKFFCANALGAGITLVVVSFVLVAVQLREGGRGRLAAIAIAAASAAVIHPLVGVPADVALLVGTALAATQSESRGTAIRCAIALVVGLVLAASVIWLMLHVGIQGGEPTTFHIVRVNVLPLMQGLDVLILPALWGWFVAWRRSRGLALFGLGFALTSLALALVLDLPYRGEAYLVYTAYLGVALFAAAGIGAAIIAIGRRIGPASAWVLVALLFLPSALLQAVAFARHDEAWGLAGYPETHDEVAAFDYLRDRIPLDAVVIDSQYFSSSSVAAYSGRRGLFGGMRQAKLVGYPREEMAEREHAVVNLLLEPGLSDTTLRVLEAIRAPLFVVARRTPPANLFTVPPAGPPVDMIAKLEGLPGPFKPLFRTPTIAVYRFIRNR